MRPNLRSLVAKAYRVRQGRTFSSSSSAPNPVGDEGAISIYEWLLPRGFATLTGFVVDSASKFDEMVKEYNKDAAEFLEKRGKLPPSWVDSVDNLNRLVGGKDVVWLPDVDTIFSPRLCKSVQVAERFCILFPKHQVPIRPLLVLFTNNMYDRRHMKICNASVLPTVPNIVAYRVRQGRTFSSSSSSAPNPIDDKGKRSVITPVWESVNRLAPWFVGGYVFKFGLEISALIKSKLKSVELHEEYLREFERYHQEKEQSRSLRPFS
ncbi:hypothetical protein YC2023_055988 [Brassica napus]